MDAITMGKSQFRKMVVTPVLSVEETWDKNLVDMELSYPDPASPAHIYGVKLPVQWKWDLKTKRHAQNQNQLTKIHVLTSLLPEEDNPQLDFNEDSSTTNDQIMEETTNNPDDLFGVNFNANSYKWTCTHSNKV